MDRLLEWISIVALYVATQSELPGIEKCRKLEIPPPVVSFVGKEVALFREINDKIEQKLATKIDRTKVVEIFSASVGGVVDVGFGHGAVDPHLAA